MSVSASRESVLKRIRASLAGSSAARARFAESAKRNSDAELRAGEEVLLEIPRDYARKGQMTLAERCARFVERLREYDAEVVECAPDGLAAAIAAQLKASGRRTFVAPAGLPAEWLAPGFEWMIDGNLEVRDVERADGVLTACFCGVAESGTIVLHHGPAEGRRVISLLPDWHLCVVRASQVVETLPEYFDRCQMSGIGGQKSREQGSGSREQQAEELPRLVTWIAGPSATADIEMTRIKGVHGPRFLNVILVND